MTERDRIEFLARVGHVERWPLRRDERAVNIGFVIFATTLALLALAYLLSAVLAVAG